MKCVGVMLGTTADAGLYAQPPGCGGQACCLLLVQHTHTTEGHKSQCLPWPALAACVVGLFVLDEALTLCNATMSLGVSMMWGTPVSTYRCRKELW